MKIKPPELIPGPVALALLGLLTEKAIERRVPWLASLPDPSWEKCPNCPMLMPPSGCPACRSDFRRWLALRRSESGRVRLRWIRATRRRLLPGEAAEDAAGRRPGRPAR